MLSCLREHLGVFLALSVLTGVTVWQLFPAKSTPLYPLPTLPGPAVNAASVLVLSSNSLWPDIRMTTYLFRDGKSANSGAGGNSAPSWQLFLFPDQTIDDDNLQLYWLPSNAPVALSLPAEAQLLGSLSQQGGRYLLSQINRENDLNALNRKQPDQKKPTQEKLRLLLYNTDQAQVVAKSGVLPVTIPSTMQLLSPQPLKQEP